MSKLSDLMESLKDGELSVVAQKLATMQTEISDALNLIGSLTTEVQGSATDTSNPVGVIHSPARPGIVNTSLEMFIGTYYVGDILSGAGKKQGSIIFGAGSECKFYFMPSDPLHGVNKKYVDQIVSPIANQLGNMIVRFGDRVPTKLGSIGECTYIYTSDDPGSVKVRWLIDGKIASIESDFNDFNADLSIFWMNVDDGRYFGQCVEDSNFANMGAIRRDCLSRVGSKTNPLAGTPAEVKDAGVLFSGSNLDFDEDSRAKWNDVRLVTAKDDTDLATIKNVKDLLPSTGGIAGPFGRFSSSFNNAGYLPLTDLQTIYGTFLEYFDIIGSQLKCKKACVVLVSVKATITVSDHDGWPTKNYIHLNQNGSSISESVRYLQTRDHDQDYVEIITLNVVEPMIMSKDNTISFSWQCTEGSNNISGAVVGTLSATVING